MSPRTPVASRLHPADVAVAAYAVVSGIVVVIGAPPGRVWLLAARGVLLAGLLALARAERGAGADPSAARAFRTLYPVAVCPLFFWEAAVLTEALWEAWWFEAPLARIDRALFGGPSVPAAFDAPWIVDELLWLLYFAYYPIVAGGLALAWWGPRGEGGPRPSVTLDPVVTATVLSMLGAYALFPVLPARAPIHAVEATPGATGGVFGHAVGWVQGWGGVTGSAFPSAHVSAAWAIVVALAPDRPRAALLLGLVAAGITAACVYTPYHWTADVAAGLALGLIAGAVGRRVTRRSGSAGAPRGTARSTASAGTSRGRA